MWGRVARRYLTLPAQGYHIATSVHADTIDDVISMYGDDVRLRPEDVRSLGLVINIGLMGRVYPPRRRWLSTHFLQPYAAPKQPNRVVPIPLSLWNEYDDTFEHADQSILDDLATWIGLSAEDFAARFKCRVDCLQELSQDRSVDTSLMYDAIQALREREKKQP